MNFQYCLCVHLLISNGKLLDHNLYLNYAKFCTSKILHSIRHYLLFYLEKVFRISRLIFVSIHEYLMEIGSAADINLEYFGNLVIKTFMLNSVRLLSDFGRNYARLGYSYSTFYNQLGYC